MGSIHYVLNRWQRQARDISNPLFRIQIEVLKPRKHGGAYSEISVQTYQCPPAKDQTY